MELFSEIYSCYYNVVSKILNNSFNSPLSQNSITKIINDNAFCESAFYILPKLIEGEWNLIEKTDAGYKSKLNNSAQFPMTNLQKAWLKALLSDKKMNLFLENKEISLLSEILSDVEPLFSFEDFYYYDKFNDGDDYENQDYISNFREILKAVKNKHPLTISFESGKGQRITGNYIPCKIQYSAKDDKFRIYVVRIKDGKIITTAIINMARIINITLSKEVFPAKLEYNSLFDKLFLQSKCSEPVVIQISTERNALERCMLHFANFEKHTEYDETTNKYLCYIYYDKHDETELLIHVLSFGPVIKVLGPESFLDLIRERVIRQYELLK